MLHDRYYLGEVRYKGETYPGRHEPLISEELFKQVQQLMDERGYARERRKRRRVTGQLSQVHGDLSSGRAFIYSHLDLLENPHELYLHASEATRRRLNQAIFAHDEVVGDDIRSPLRELLAAERAWETLTAG